VPRRSRQWFPAHGRRCGVHVVVVAVSCPLTWQRPPPLRDDGRCRPGGYFLSRAVKADQLDAGTARCAPSWSWLSLTRTSGRAETSTQFPPWPPE
jgi:hypothetical protein